MRGEEEDFRMFSSAESVVVRKIRCRGQEHIVIRKRYTMARWCWSSDSNVVVEILGGRRAQICVRFSSITNNSIAIYQSTIYLLHREGQHLFTRPQQAPV